MAASLLGTVDLSAFLQVLALWVQWAPCQGFAWAFPEVPRILVNRKCHEIHRMKVKDHRQFIRFMEDTRLFISVFHVFVPSAGFCSLIPGYVKLWTSWNWTTTPQDIVTNQTPLDGLRLCPVLYDIFISMFFGFGGGHFAGLPHVFFFFRVSKAFGDYAIGADHHGALQDLYRDIFWILKGLSMISCNMKATGCQMKLYLNHFDLLFLFWFSVFTMF